LDEEKRKKREFREQRAETIYIPGSQDMYARIVGQGEMHFEC
jgi:hypothetical protein